MYTEYGKHTLKSDWNQNTPFSKEIYNRSL